MNPPPRQPVKKTTIATRADLRPGVVLRNGQVVKKEPAVVGSSLLQPSTAFAMSQAFQTTNAPAPQQQQLPSVPQPQTVYSSANRAPETMMMQMEELTKFLTQEIELLKSRDIKAINEHLQIKYRMIANYEANYRAIAAHPELLMQLTPEMRKKLKATALTFAESAQKNETALKGAVEATKRVIKNIIGMIRAESLPQKATYANLRHSRLATGAYSPMCPAIAVNRTA